MELASDRTALVGMVHLLPLPGSPGFPRLVRELAATCPAHVHPTRHAIRQMLDRARFDAEALLENGCDALLVENMHDLPYLRGVAPTETVAAMALGCEAVAAFDAPFGVQILAGANLEALGVAVATGATFMRAEAFAYAHVADEGWLDAAAGPLLRRRADLGADLAPAISIWADVKKKHSAHAVTADLSLADAAHGAAFCGADAVIITGSTTGATASIEDVIAARYSHLPVVVGSGITPANAAVFAAHAQALIVGSALKVDGDWRKPVDPARVRALADALGKRTA